MFLNIPNSSFTMSQKVLLLVYVSTFLTGHLPKSVHGIDVAGFQLDGVYSSRPHLRYDDRLGFGENLNSLTICLRLFTHYLRGYTSYFLSYYTKQSDDSLQGIIYKPSFDSTLKMGLCKHKFMHDECGYVDVPTFEFFRWYHLCMVYNATLIDDLVNVNIKVFLDGQQGGSDTTTVPLNDFIPLSRDGILVLGQEQDGPGGYFDETQSFSGELTQVEVWNSLLSQDDIQDLASCNRESVATDTQVVSWILSKWIVSPEVAMRKEDQLDNLCRPSVLKNWLIWADRVTYKQMSDVCKRMDGVMPTQNNDDTQVIHDEAYQRFIALDDSLDQCAFGADQVKFWLADDQDVTDDPGSYCQFVFGHRVEKDFCSARFPCGLCELPPTKRLLIKGLCSKDLESKYDVDFVVYGTMNGKAHFRGSQNSHLFYDSTIMKWKLQSLRNESKFIQTAARLPEQLPIGTHVWEITVQDALCGLKVGSTLELTMSQCFPNMYTCNSGDCIPLSDKCNTEINCADKSDEYNCDYLRFGANYAKELIPRDEKGEALTVYINVSVLAFPFIETVNLKFTADFFLNLRWYDLRIDFRDLNNVTSLNSLSSNDQEQIWTPKLGFTNALGPFQTTVDDLTTGILVREANPLDEDITLSTEAMLFSGRDNAILLTREYYQDYACNFDLLYYPFDTQMCEMVFEVQGKTDNYVRLAKDGVRGIEFLGGRTLVEYEIQLEDLQFASVQNISRAIVKFVFRRRMEFHVTNTFLQTFILVCVGYFSYYFDLDNFTDRIMVVLTTMLVVATITSAIQASLPKTSYYKMIDWWLLVSLNILVVTMAFHTFLAHTVSKARQRANGNSVGTGFISTKSSNQVSNSATRPQTAMAGGAVIISRRPKSPMEHDDEKEELLYNEEMAGAKRLNDLGKVVYVAIIIAFNIFFWVVAITEYVRPAEEYIY